MTNVPDNIREAWKDIYILFDTNYGMDGSEVAWEKFWLAGCELIKKHGDNVPLMEIIEAIAHMIETFVNERKTGNKTLVWDRDTDYPYPRKEET